MVLGDGIFDDKGGLTIVSASGDRFVEWSATFERALTTEILQCFVRAGWSVDFKVVQPQ